FVVRPEEHAASALKQRLRKAHALQQRQQLKLLKQIKAMSSVGPIDSLLQRVRSPLAGLEQLIEQSGARMSVSSVLLASGTLALIGFIVIQRFTAGPLQKATGGVLAGLALAVVVGGLLAYAPFAVLRFMRTRRLRKFEEQFPEALDLLSRALRAGHAFTTGIEM